jgi:hypothetical protein
MMTLKVTPEFFVPSFHAIHPSVRRVINLVPFYASPWVMKKGKKALRHIQYRK